MEYRIQFKAIRGQAKKLEAKYQAAILDCQRIVRAFYAANGGIAGYTAHAKEYAGLQVFGARGECIDKFELREHLSQNESQLYVDTGEYPYDTIVSACLIVLRHRLGNAIDVSSDGTRYNWNAGVRLALGCTRLKVKNPVKA